MSRWLIKIKWHYGTEFISIDPCSVPSEQSYITTVEYWPDEHETVRYTVLCTRSIKSPSALEMTLQYSTELNQSLKGRNESWGFSTLSIDSKARKVKASWKDLRSGGDHDGPGRCELLDDSLLDELSYEQISRLKKPEQSSIRRELLKVYGKCALTGETTPSVLEAAHIIEAGKQGSYTLTNCILLRADLHKLFDRGLLTFSSSGEVNLAPEIKGNYVQQLTGKSLPIDVLENVKSAMSVRYGRD